MLWISFCSSWNGESTTTTVAISNVMLILIMMSLLLLLLLLLYHNRLPWLILDSNKRMKMNEWMSEWVNGNLSFSRLSPCIVSSLTVLFRWMFGSLAFAFVIALCFAVAGCKILCCSLCLSYSFFRSIGVLLCFVSYNQLVNPSQPARSSLVLV